MTAYVIPLIFLTVLVMATAKRKNAYKTFIEGAKDALSLMANVFPYLLAVMFAVELFRVSGVSAMLARFVAPAMRVFGLPPELAELMLIRPLSGAGALAVLENIYAVYGTDTYIGLCASVVYGSSETVFYIASVYFSQSNVKNLRYALPVALVATFLGSILGCLLLRLV